MLTNAMRGYDAWVTREPDYPDILVPGDEGYPTCECGAFLCRDGSMTPAFVAFGVYIKPVPYVTWETWEYECSGSPGEFDAECGSLKDHEPHKFVAWAAQLTHRICKRCGRDNIEVDA